MVCIYCGGPTQVINSRPQKRQNTIWRRRKCLDCAALFSSNESAAYDKTLVVQSDPSHIVPFYRDRLFLSIYAACRHRTHAAEDATALTNTILGQLLAKVDNASIKRSDIIALTSHALKRFDTVAQVQYDAFHPQEDIESR